MTVWGVREQRYHYLHCFFSSPPYWDACCEQFTIVFSNLRFNEKFLQATMRACLPGWQLSSEIPASVLLSKNCNNPWNPILHFYMGWLVEYWSGSHQACQACSYGPDKLCLRLLLSLYWDCRSDPDIGSWNTRYSYWPDAWHIVNSLLTVVISISYEIKEAESNWSPLSK